MSQPYDFKSVEQDAQAAWEHARAFEVREEPGKLKYYALTMLPYPSGALHIGHVRNYTIGDVVSRFRRAQGYNVLQPMGWDAFGMPAENAAIERGAHPAEWTYTNITTMRQTLKELGLAYDWSREFATCQPEYYRWEQWFFTQLMDKGLAYRKLGFVNWCEQDQTVLANEQVEEGCCWRCGNPVERREIEQWFLRITDYAQELLEGLDTLSDWPEAVKTMQRNWIGRSEGVEFDWQVPGQDAPIRVYTTRPDTVMGVTFMALAAEHPLVREVAARNEQVAAYVRQCQQGGTSEAAIETQEKTGMPLGINAVHPITGEPVPLWVANYVLITYGGGAVMGVPAHDQRDWEFARKYDLPIQQVVDSASEPVSVSEAAFTDKEGTISVNSAQFDGLDFAACFEAVAAYLQAHANGERKVNYRLRDWLVSRQRFWGAPIPVIYDAEGEAYPVPAQDLPVVLPEDLTMSGFTSPLKSDERFIHTTVPGSDTPGRRETDTFDTFFESSWYYARYCCPGADAMLDERANYWLPIDIYIGGIEHAVLHLLYFRFFHKLMRDLGLVQTDEPCRQLLTQGMVVAETFYREEGSAKRYFSPSEVTLEFDDKGRVVQALSKEDGQPVTVGSITKMSKSKRNGVEPGPLMQRYGADTVRLFAMFAAPPDQALEWRESGVEGMHRFLKRLWRLCQDYQVALASEPASAGCEARRSEEVRRKLHDTLRKVEDDYGRRLAFNTAMAAIMELCNELQKLDVQGANDRALLAEALPMVLQMLAPVTPHICHVLWQQFDAHGSIVDAPWPQVDESALRISSVELVVQVNGKLRGRIQVAADADRESCLQAARADETVQRFLDGKQVVKEVVVPNKLVNLVVK